MSTGSGIDWAGPAIGGALALAGSAVAQWLQGRGARRLAEDVRIATQRQQHLGLVTDVVINARVWADGAHILLLGLHKGGSSFAMEFVETDSGRERQALVKEFNRTLTRAKVSVTDPTLRALLVDLSTRVDNAAEEINGPAMQSQTHTPTFADLLASQRKLYALERLVTRIEGEAMRLSAAPVGDGSQQPRRPLHQRAAWRSAVRLWDRWTAPKRP